MLGRLKRLLCRRAAGQRSSQEAQPALDLELDIEVQVEAEAAPVAACLQVRALTLDEFFVMMMENRLREEREELGAGGDATTISGDSSDDLGVEERPRPAARLWRWRSPIRERRPSRRHKILQCLKQLCCLRVADQEVEEDVQEEEQRARHDVGQSVEEQGQRDAEVQEDAVLKGLEILQKKPLLSFEKFLLLSILLDQLKRWDEDDGSEDEGYEGDVEEPLPSTSAAVRTVAARTSQPPGGASPLRGRRRRRRQGGQTRGPGGRIRRRRGYRLFSRVSS